MTHQGTTSLLALADDLREKSSHVADYWDHKLAAAVMQDAADALDRLAHLEPDIEVVVGEA